MNVVLSRSCSTQRQTPCKKKTSSWRYLHHLPFARRTFLHDVVFITIIGCTKELVKTLSDLSFCSDKFCCAYLHQMHFTPDVFCYDILKRDQKAYQKALYPKHVPEKLSHVTRIFITTNILFSKYAYWTLQKTWQLGKMAVRQCEIWWQLSNREDICYLLSIIIKCDSSSEIWTLEQL